MKKSSSHNKNAQSLLLVTGSVLLFVGMFLALNGDRVLQITGVTLLIAASALFGASAGVAQKPRKNKKR